MNMKWLQSRVTWGLLLILAGVLFLVQNFFFKEQAGIIWAGLFLLAALYFLAYFFFNRRSWWALIPGVILLSLGVLIGMAVLNENAGEQWGGTVFLGGIGLAFLLVYLADRSNWWAIIPGGVMFTLALVASPAIVQGNGWNAGAIFFLGLGLTFALLGTLPTPEGRFRLKWAFIPAMALLAVGAVVAVAATELLGWILPAFLIVGGGLLLFQALAGKRKDEV
jgi:hypothetical protein